MNLNFPRVIGACLLGPLLYAASAPMQAADAQVFKGSWAGPAVRKLPGPGPAPGETLEHYFANLKTGPRGPSKKHVLVLGGARKFQHDSIPTAMASIFAWGESNGLWDAELRTDFSLVRDQGGAAMNAGFQPKGLRDFDAIVVASADGEWELDPGQKRALLDFVRAGKGLVVIHAGIDANHAWPDYIDMIGGEQVGHPYNTLEQPIYAFTLVSENREFPATGFLPRRFIKQDELYTLRNWSRSDVEVLLRIDDAMLNDAGDEAPPDHDLPVAWIKSYGKGRVFASTLGHTREAFKDPDIARMYSEAIKWSLGLSGDAPPAPHPKR